MGGGKSNKGYHNGAGSLNSSTIASALAGKGHSYLSWGLESQPHVPSEPLLLLLATANQNTLVVLEDRPLFLIRSLGLRKA